MVSTSYESDSCKLWKPVVRPASNPSPRAGVQNPKLLQTPNSGGKVCVYIYEAPEGSFPQEVVDLAASDSWSQYARLAVSENHFLPGNQESFVNLNEFGANNNSTINKVKRQAKKAGKGFKVLADVTPADSRNTSKGQKMFIKQKNRMKHFTSSATNGINLNLNKEIYKEEESTPWEINQQTYATGNHIPQFLPHKSSIKKRKQKGKILPPLHSPPPEWRAKVESNYRIGSDEPFFPSKRWNGEVPGSLFYSARSESAPPPLPSQASCELIIDQSERKQGGSVSDIHSESKNIFRPASVVRFDARKHKQAPHRKQGVRAGKGIVMTTPHVENDFNARAVGWSKAYANQY